MMFDTASFKIIDKKNVWAKYEGGLKSFRPQHEDGSTRKWKLVNVVVHLLTVTH